MKLIEKLKALDKKKKIALAIGGIAIVGVIGAGGIFGYQNYQVQIAEQQRQEQITQKQDLIKTTLKDLSDHKDILTADEQAQLDIVSKKSVTTTEEADQLLTNIEKLKAAAITRVKTELDKKVAETKILDGANESENASFQALAKELQDNLSKTELPALKVAKLKLDEILVLNTTIASRIGSEKGLTAEEVAAAGGAAGASKIVEDRKQAEVVAQAKSSTPSSSSSGGSQNYSSGSNSSTGGSSGSSNYNSGGSSASSSGSSSSSGGGSYDNGNQSGQWNWSGDSNVGKEIDDIFNKYH